MVSINAPFGRRPAAKNETTQNFILLGSSTGGVDALIQILRHFGSDCPPTLIVQHTGNQFAQSLIRLLDGATRAKVVAAQDGAMLERGLVYLSPSTEQHLCLAENLPLRIALNKNPPRTSHRPSVDALFESAVPHAANATAAILTGMGKDGAQGLLSLRQAGAQTVGQDESTSIVYGMPRVAHALGGVARALPITEIGPALLRAAIQRT
ncbi:CheB methylesterase domain-containing protein [Yoonia sp. I 8.24]|uniref:CheB methylesterase domain-containing protein n=1 Tax=Yoonia sp. I 8.24 TaxID=1537229 RepID=UPI001EE060A2|nr:CheB methylesterase domain-containing protein [Yoonia sp. I 8.24]